MVVVMERWVFILILLAAGWGLLVGVIGLIVARHAGKDENVTIVVFHKAAGWFWMVVDDRVQVICSEQGPYVSYPAAMLDGQTWVNQQAGGAALDGQMAQQMAQQKNYRWQ